MHIPDGFLDAKAAIASSILAAGALGMALRSVRRTVPERRLPLIGLASAFVFAAQMINFPVAGGTSGHLIGAMLVSVLLGPSAAVLVMSAVLVLQCFMFADGGVTALGANIFNMAVIAPFIGYSAYRAVFRFMKGSVRARLAGTAFGAWCSIVAASIACAGQLALSGTVTWEIVLSTMAGLHMLIGSGEALVTTLVVAVIARVRPELLPENGETNGEQRVKPGYRELVAYGILVSLGLAIFVAPFACGWPDGLGKTAEILGFGPGAAEKPVVASPLPGYTLPGLGSAGLSAFIVGCTGVMLAFLLAYFLARLLTPGAPLKAGIIRKENEHRGSRI